MSSTTLLAERSQGVVRPSCPANPPCTTPKRELVRCKWNGAAWRCPSCGATRAP